MKSRRRRPERWGPWTEPQAPRLPDTKGIMEAYTWAFWSKHRAQAPGPKGFLGDI